MPFLTPFLDTQDPFQRLRAYDETITQLCLLLKTPVFQDDRELLREVVGGVKRLLELSQQQAGELESLRIDLQQLKQTAKALAHAADTEKAEAQEWRRRFKSCQNVEDWRLRSVSDHAAEMAFRRDLVVAIAAQHIENSSAKWICIQADDVARTQLARERDRLVEAVTTPLSHQEEQDG